MGLDMEISSSDICKKEKDHKWKVINLTPFTRKCIICNKEEVYEWGNEFIKIKS